MKKHNSQKYNKYIFSADVVRVLAIVGVVGIHIVTQITDRPDFFGGTFWWVLYLLATMFRMSVPLFMMLSGYLTLGKKVGLREQTVPESSIRENTTRVIRRLVIPLLSFYALNNLVSLLVSLRRAEEFPYWEFFHNLSKNTNSSLYFLVVLAIIQLLNPIWNILAQKQYLPVFRYVCRFFFALGLIGTFFYYLSLRNGVAFNTFTFWILWIGYYLYGYLVRLQTRVATPQETIRSAALLVGGYVATVVFGFLTLSSRMRGGSELFLVGGQPYADSYLSVSVVAMSIGAFQLLMRTRAVASLEKISWIRIPVAVVAALSFAIFLIHVSLIEVQGKLLGITADSPSMPGIVGFVMIHFALTFLVSGVLAWIFRKTPVLRALVGESRSVR